MVILELIRHALHQRRLKKAIAEKRREIELISMDQSIDGKTRAALMLDVLKQLSDLKLELD